ncbi:TetR family transcriptional regulator C-terminal domain-containing protein [Streptomyces somaliensis DSM 40738]|uniref:TetR/AcrR family transcriptional regulator n=1 Tax=Streptomyces somaliensis (strain ATCC 33201 / DSM 40738 / JCM 12659 / KCTC 9044 / NCTC 11332 / NRRL B-12077 / IP 733) TaxID=1134445 RepID=A0AA44ICG9_STRE0|nr:TetR/AcrR family transcriptional regulator [Streptomyces somaliensis]MCQ0025057.1 TetR family transcriptional regulator C-terminal domain-containing protein [Streptomyces somaliensis DSM 40738]NKY13163.1 TetR/AcrR family transcriptional regulator [Streptomyces somaliensis DSM 40738]
MPRQVDHVGRRRLIAEAVCHLADERGLEGVTLRDVAARAQVSMGAVQRCFRTKEEMLVFALGHVGERIGERVQARLVRSPAQSAGTALGHAANEISLLGEEHRAEARVWLAFVAQAAVSKALAGTLKANYAALQEAFTRLISQAGEGTDRAVPLDPQREARTLLALADGLTTHVLIGHLTPQEAHDVLHEHLAGLWEQPVLPPRFPEGRTE